MITKKLAELIAEQGINISALSRATGIKRGILHASLSAAVDDEKRRPLRDDELGKVCRVLKGNPMDLME